MEDNSRTAISSILVRQRLEMSSAPDIITLQTSPGAKHAARHAFLNDVVDQLTPWEWRNLLTTLAARSFHYDILGNLPVELVHRVAGYLDGVDIISSRRVSKRWQELLRSEELCRKICFQKSLTSQQQLYKNMSWEALLSRKTCMMYSLAQGRPWSKVYHRIFLPKDPKMRIAAYHNGKFAFVHYSSSREVASAISIIRFQDGDTIPIPLDGLAGPVRSIALSDSLFSCLLDRYDHPRPSTSRSVR